VSTDTPVLEVSDEELPVGEDREDIEHIAEHNPNPKLRASARVALALLDGEEPDEDDLELLRGGTQT